SLERESMVVHGWCDIIGDEVHRQAPGNVHAPDALCTCRMLQIFGKPIDRGNMFGGVLQCGCRGCEIEVDLVEPWTIEISLQKVLTMISQPNTPMRMCRVLVIDGCLRGDTEPERRLEMFALFDEFVDAVELRKVINA